jgi:ribosomal subunit interface protein
MDIVFKGRHTDVLERFRKHATSKLARVEKLDQKVIRIDVEVSTERNPRQSGRRERVELTITTRGPAIRAEAAAEDRFAALDLALAKLDGRLRRACERRKDRHAPAAGAVPAGSAAAPSGSAAPIPASRPASDGPLFHRESPDGEVSSGFREDEVPIFPNGTRPTEPAVNLDNRVPIEMEGEGPLVIREKFHVACPMTIDQALFEMELVGHDFFLFTDTTDGLPSVVYRRRGYQYGVIRLVEEAADQAVGKSAVPRPGLAPEQSPAAANLA